MKKKKMGIIAALGLSATLLLGACSSGGEKDYEFLSIVTGGTTGTYYALGGTLATIIEDETGKETTAEVSQATATSMDGYDSRKTKAKGRSMTIMTGPRGIEDETLTLGRKSLLGQ